MVTIATDGQIAAAVEEINARFAMLTGGANVGRIMDLAKPNDPAFIEQQRFEEVFTNQGNCCPLPQTRNAECDHPSCIVDQVSDRREYSDIGFGPHDFA